MASVDDTRTAIAGESMRIRKIVQTEQEISIDIGIDDIAEALLETFKDAKHNPGCDPPKTNQVTWALSHVGQFLRALTDDQISMLNAHQRQLVVEFLTEQAKRFAVIDTGTGVHGSASSAPAIKA